MENNGSASQSTAQLSEEQLRSMSRRIKDTVPDNVPAEEDLNKLRATVVLVCETAATPGLDGAHRLAAWNTLCAIIDRCLSSREDVYRDIIFGKGVHLQAFHLFLSQSHSARPKLSKQLLVTVAAALRKSPDRPASTLERNSIVRALVDYLTSGDDHAKAKASIMALGHFLGKDIITLELVLEVMQRSVAPEESSDHNATLRKLLVILFQLLGRADFGSAISHLMAVVLDRDRSVQSSTKDGTKSAPVWAAALRQAHQQVAVDIADLRTHLLPVLFKRSLDDYASFLNDLGLRSLMCEGKRWHDDVASARHGDEELLFASLQTGKDLGLLYETEGRSFEQTNECVLMPISAIGRLLSQESRAARLTGLSLLINSHAATRPIPVQSLKLVQLHLSHFFADTDANFRSEVFSMLQRLLDRIRAVTAVLSRQASRPGAESSKAASTLRTHRAFLETLFRLVTWELRPTASYQRHISALKCFLIIVRSGLDSRIPTHRLAKSAMGETKWPFDVAVATTDVRRLLLNLLVDPFDDVRQTAATILLYQPYDPILERQLLLALKRAEAAMLATGRADQADGVAHIYTLLDQQRAISSVDHEPSEENILLHLARKLDDMLHNAEVDLSHAVERYPMHGLLTSLRYVLEQNPTQLTSDISDRLTTALKRIWKVVNPILCNDAPEGYLPEELEETAEVSTKDTLSYCWRALKEASLLLGVMMSATKPAFVVGSDGRLSLSELCFTELAELRHRGAFSTVAQTWIICCTQSRDIKTVSCQLQLQAWYDKVMLILHSRTTINTRRSAGLPSLLCGILIADKSGKLMQQAFADLEAVAREEVDIASAHESSLAQVHAMNCMKDILKNSKLGEHSERHVAAALQLAAYALRSEAWAIRNCGLMLFRAVIDRLFGTTEAVLEDEVESPKRLSSEQHPQLFDIVMNLLSTTLVTGVANLLSSRFEGVFPALQLLQRLQIPAAHRAEVKQHVFALTASPVWHVRDKAARTYASLISSENTLHELQNLLKTGMERQNALHGALLCAKYLFRGLAVKHRSAASSIGSEGDAGCGDLVYQCWLAVADGAGALYNTNQCPITKRAYLDLFAESLQSLRHCDISVNLAEHAYPAEANRTTNLTSLPFLDDLRRTLDEGNIIKPSGALLRPLLARTVALESISGPHMAATTVNAALLKELAITDTDACIELLAKRKMSCSTSEASSTDTATVITACNAMLQSDTTSLRLQCEALRTLLHITEDPTRRRQGFSDFADSWSLAVTMTKTTNQTCTDLSLELQAACLECRSETEGPESASFLRDLQGWAARCELAMGGESVYSREAAALAISRLRTTWQTLAATPLGRQLYCRLCIVTYDLLNDDDEDMRLLAAAIAERTLAVGEHYRTAGATIPLIASQQLASFFVREWLKDADLAKSALARAFGTSQFSPLTVCDLLDQYGYRDNALFAEEKQNLYIDEAREVRLWSQVLSRLDHRVLSWQTLKSLSDWAIDGLQTLTAKITSDADGALGWTTNVDIFVLGLRVIYCADLLLHLGRRGRKLPVPPSLLRCRLREFAAANSTGDANCFWRYETDRVLGDSILRKVVDVKELLFALSGQLNGTEVQRGF